MCTARLVPCTSAEAWARTQHCGALRQLRMWVTWQATVASSVTVVNHEFSRFKCSCQLEISLL